MPFAPADLAALEATEEIEIETRSGVDTQVRRTIIWVMTDGADAFVRSVRGPAGRWYREAVADSRVVVHAGGRVLAAQAIPASDEDSIARANEGLRRKYLGIDGYDEMLIRDTFPTTLRLEPA